MKERFNLDLSIVDEIQEDIDLFRTSESFLDRYEQELIRRKFDWEYIVEVLKGLVRWYDIVRLARRTRRVFERYKEHCRAMNVEPGFQAPDTLEILEQADRRDPQGNPRELARMVKRLAGLLRRCREVIVSLMEENERLRAGARREEMAPADEREAALALSVPSPTHRKESIRLMEGMTDTAQFVRMVQWLVNEHVVDYGDAHSLDFVRPFVPYLPEAKRLSRRAETLCDNLREKLVMPKQ